MGILVIKNLKYVIGNARGINRLLLKLHEDPTENKKEMLRIRRTWVTQSYLSQRRVMITEKKDSVSIVTVGSGVC